MKISIGILVQWSRQIDEGQQNLNYLFLGQNHHKQQPKQRTGFLVCHCQQGTQLVKIKIKDSEECRSFKQVSATPLHLLQNCGSSARFRMNTQISIIKPVKPALCSISSNHLLRFRFLRQLIDELQQDQHSWRHSRPSESARFVEKVSNRIYYVNLLQINHPQQLKQF